MTLNDDVQAALPGFRAEALARMTSTATVYREGAPGTPDPDTGVESRTFTAILTASPFRLGGSERGGSGSRKVDVGGVEVTLATRVGHFPATTTGLQDGDLIDVLTGENAGTVWRIVEGDWADQQTARRVPIVAAERPEEWP